MKFILFECVPVGLNPFGLFVTRDRPTGRNLTPCALCLFVFLPYRVKTTFYSLSVRVVSGQSELSTFARVTVFWSLNGPNRCRFTGSLGPSRGLYNDSETTGGLPLKVHRGVLFMVEVSENVLGQKTSVKSWDDREYQHHN